MTTPPTAQDRDLALLSATAHRHAPTTPLVALAAVAAAVDELTDPLRLPLTFNFPAGETADLTAVLTQVRARMIRAIPSDTDPGRALARGRAARELAAALRLLDTPPAAAGPR